MEQERTTAMNDLIAQFENERNILIYGEVNAEMALRVMLLLRKFDQDDPDEPIYLYINSPGGNVSDGLMIVDNMDLVHAPVYTVVVGLAASMGAVIATAGEKGHRYILANSQLMIHQPWNNINGGAGIKQSDMAAMAKELTNTRNKLERVMQRNANVSLEEIHNACELDNFLDPDEAIAMGLCDKVIQGNKTGKVE